MQPTRKKRITIQQDVVINGSLRAEGLDLSEDGMYIYTRASFIPQSVIEVKFNLDGEPFSVSAVVQHSQPGIGVGVMFADMTDDTAEKIKVYMSRAARKNGDQTKP